MQRSGCLYTKLARARFFSRPGILIRLMVWWPYVREDVIICDCMCPQEKKKSTRFECIYSLKNYRRARCVNDISPFIRLKVKNVKKK